MLGEQSEAKLTWPLQMDIQESPICNCRGDTHIILFCVIITLHKSWERIPSKPSGEEVTKEMNVLAYSEY